MEVVLANEKIEEAGFFFLLGQGGVTEFEIKAHQIKYSF